MKCYKDLIVWRRARELTRETYRFGAMLPRSEKYRLEDQMCRASISIISNIAEGSSRGYIGDYIRFLNIAFASSIELEAQILVVTDLFKNLNPDKIIALNLEVQKMLFVLIRKLQIHYRNSK